MGAKSGFALKLLQWFIRGIQFCCAALILALFSYFLAVAADHHTRIPTWLRAVEGISGAAVLYTIIGLLLLCCLAGHPVTSFIAILLDIAFVGAFIYVATANRGGASSCRGNNITTPFGTGRDVDHFHDGFPTNRTLCQMESACLAVAIVAIVFFLLSALVEFVLVRHRRKERRFGPSPANNYTSGYGSQRKGFFGRFRRSGTANTEDPNALPVHTHPDQVRPSYNTETTAVGHDMNTYGNSNGTSKYDNSGYNNSQNGAYSAAGGYHPTTNNAAGYPTHGTAQDADPVGYGYSDGTYTRR
ncbi:hypothetical protein F4780DRAFT_778205 [Xylariomycetidae sp. FL0641]|nr:hypothetical protein F4780DRAFT_778205 [Xylariomycetidae sp. FL0641]